MKQPIASQPEKLDRWLTRHARDDGYARWCSERGTSKAPFLAFKAIATDGRLLLRLSHRDAAALVKHAELQVSRALISEGAEPGAASATEIVPERISSGWTFENHRCLGINRNGHVGCIGHHALPVHAKPG